MPNVGRRGYLKIARETSPGVLSTSALLGASYGPLATTLAATTGPFGLTTPALGIPVETHELEGKFGKVFSSMQVGRRFEDVMMVPGRNSMDGQFTGPVTPDIFGYLLFLALGVDVVTPSSVTTCTGAGNIADATALTFAALPSNIKANQRVWFNDGANSEYANVSADVASGQTAVVISGGGGAGGGLKFPHAATTPVQFGPWTHKLVPSNSANGIPTFLAEDNWGGATNSQVHTGCSIDSLEIAAPIENATAEISYTAKVLGIVGAPAGVTGSGAYSLPSEEVIIAAGNAATFTATGATLPSAPFNSLYLTDLKATIANNVKLAAASAGSPNPYSTIATNFSLKGSGEIVFEGGYETYQDYANSKIWAPTVFGFTWATKSLVGTAGAQAATLNITMQQMGLENAGKPSIKNDMVVLPVSAFRALDYPDFGGANGPIATFAITNNIAVY